MDNSAKSLPMDAKQKVDRRGAPKGRLGNVAHEVTEANKAVVETHAAVGTPHETIAYLLGISADTLTKYYREQLDHGMWKAAASVAGQMHSIALGKRLHPVSGNVEAVDANAQIAAGKYWLDRRGGPGWRQRQQHDHGFGMGSGEVDTAPDQNEVVPTKITVEFVKRADGKATGET